MIRQLVLSILLAGLALAMFAERLGLPVSMARNAVFAGVAFSLGLLILSAATSRLANFLCDPGAGLATTAIGHALHFGLALFILAGMSSLSLPTIAAVALSFLAGIVILPGYRADERIISPYAYRLRRDEGAILLMATGGLAALALVAIYPNLTAHPTTTLGAPFVIQPELPLVIVAIAIVIGGAGVITPLAWALLFLVTFFAIPPALAILIEDLPDLRLLIRDPRAILELRPALPDWQSLRVNEMLLPCLIGAGTALVSKPLHAHLGSRWGRALAPPVGLACVGIMAGIAMMVTHRLDARIATEFVGQMPSRWPVFAFDEGLRGWLFLCGRAPLDALDVVQACRNAGVALPPAAGTLTIDAGLKPMALASSLQLPQIMGVVWVLLAQLAMVIVLGLLLHRAGTTFSEIVVHRGLDPRGLKASRLIQARLSVALLAALLWHLSRTTPPSADFLRFATLAMLLLAAGVLAGALVRRAAVRLNRYRATHQTRKSPAILALPEPDCPARA